MKPDFELNLDDWKKVPKKLAKKVEIGIKKTAQAILNASRTRVPNVTENLYSSGGVDIQGSGLETEGTIKYTAFYAPYVEKGTGLYGPKKQKIYPKNGQALFWPGAAHPVKSIKGQKPQPFLGPAFEEESPKLADYVFN
jgi:HK97 gp10 family phage protein